MCDKSKQPIEIELEAGQTYSWCKCGRSDNQPFCNGTHYGSGMEPKIFKVSITRKVWLCVCKRTKLVPYCDGAHVEK